MTDRAAETRDFLSLCEDSVFPHKEELLAGIASGICALTGHHEGKVSARSLIDIYAARQRRISPKSGTHAERLAKDIESFVESLRSNGDDFVSFWAFSVNESSDFLLFEGLSTRKILGCLFTVDKRKVTEQEWQTLWNE